MSSSKGVCMPVHLCQLSLQEGNRLGVQVGSRLYKVDAQEVTV